MYNDSNEQYQEAKERETYVPNQTVEAVTNSSLVMPTLGFGIARYHEPEWGEACVTKSSLISEAVARFDHF